MCSGMGNVPCDELANSVVIFNKQVLRSCYIWYYLMLFSVLFLFFFLSQELNVSHSTFHLILARISIPPKKCHDSVGFRVDKSHTMLFFFPSIFLLHSLITESVQHMIYLFDYPLSICSAFFLPVLNARAFVGLKDLLGKYLSYSDLCRP